MTDITGKKKIVVDKSIFIDLDRTLEGQIAASLPKILGGLYFNHGPGYGDIDSLRVALGKHWDYDFPATLQATPGGTKLLKGPSPIDYEDSDGAHSNAKIKVFCNNVLNLDECEDLYDPTGETVQKIVLSCEVPEPDFNQAFSSVPQAQEEQSGFGLTYWAYLMQYGVIPPQSTVLHPIVTTDKYYYDHYHETIQPFTPEELVSQQPAGKAYFIDYEAFYNNRASSTQSGITNIDYENFIAQPDYQNCIPNIYAFAKTASDVELSQDQFFDIGEIIHGGDDNFNKHVPGGITLKDFGESDDNPTFVRRDLFATLFQYYPLEAGVLLYDAMAPEEPNADIPTIQQILKLDAKKTDATALFGQWFQQFKRVLTEDNRFARVPTYSGPDTPQTVQWFDRYGLSPKTKLGALEYINSNLVFSPYAAAALLKKAEQYKNYFPMYFQMNFTAQLSTEIGDLIKDYKLGKFLATAVAATNRAYGSGPNSGFDKFSQDTSTSLPFIDFVEKKVYENIAPGDPATGKATFITLPATGIQDYLPNDKRTIDIKNVIDSYVDEQDYSSGNLHPLFDNAHIEPNVTSTSLVFDDKSLNFDWVEDVRNYMTYIRSDIDEPVGLDSDCNQLFKYLAWPVITDKLQAVYNANKRTYKDILDGKPAHTEDLFYLIKKFRKSTASASPELNVQNIIIPNTSDLNVVNYIDTQVKYGKDAIYRYEVFVYRIVFGCKYRYSLEQSKTLDPIDSAGMIENLELGMPSGITNPDALNFGGLLKQGDNFYATYEVNIEPSIQLIADKVFSTPDVKILDDPPVPPYVNIVPYRAVNDKIKIILNGSTDTFRAEPVIILNGDTQEFNDIKAAQFSYDGKVRFSSDDRISGFQVFRIEQKPLSYGDFELHPTSPSLEGGSAALDDSLLPNKKYYYTFRAIDNHGHVSNPTPVYEVELIDEKGAVKPLIRTVSMEKEEDKESVKDCQKYILLKPTDKQIYFSGEEDVKSVFSTSDIDKRKRYKVRITSKGTGKKIDINFSFFKTLQEPND